MSVGGVGGIGTLGPVQGPKEWVCGGKLMATPMSHSPGGALSNGSVGPHNYTGNRYDIYRLPARIYKPPVTGTSQLCVLSHVVLTSVQR